MPDRKRSRDDLSLRSGVSGSSQAYLTLGERSLRRLVMAISQILAPETSDGAGKLDQGQLYGEVVGAFEEVALLTTSDSADMIDVLRMVRGRLCEPLRVTRCFVDL